MARNTGDESEMSAKKAGEQSSAALHPKVSVIMLTDVGVVRDHNEDSAFVDPEGNFFIVADGMGGHAAGEIASGMAVESVAAVLGAARERINAFAAAPNEEGRRELAQLIQDAVLSAHKSVFQRGNREIDKQGMGTTLDVLLIAGNEAFIAHVGDSRTYLLRNRKASQITTDHTVAQVAVIEGRISMEEALVSPWRTVLVNAIGVSADVGVEMAHLPLQPGDRLLVCSDGLHDYFVEDEEVSQFLHDGDFEVQLQTMVDMAKDRRGHDNITGIALSIDNLAGGSNKKNTPALGVVAATTGTVRLSQEAIVSGPMSDVETSPMSLSESLAAEKHANVIRDATESVDAESKPNKK